MEAQYAPDLSHFGNHPDVHLISTEHELSQIQYPKERQQAFLEHMKNAQRVSRQIGEEGHGAIEPHRIPLKTYINHTIRTGTDPSVEGFIEHYKKAHQKGIDKVKSAKAKEAKTVEMQRAMQHVLENKHHFHNMLQLHKHLQGAKDQLVNTLSSKAEFGHSIKGKKAKPEGFVVVRNNRPTKFVDRKEFSAANFNRGE